MQHYFFILRDYCTDEEVWKKKGYADASLSLASIELQTSLYTLLSTAETITTLSAACLLNLSCLFLYWCAGNQSPYLITVKNMNMVSLNSAFITLNLFVRFFSNLTPQHFARTLDLELYMWHELLLQKNIFPILHNLFEGPNLPELPKNYREAFRTDAGIVYQNTTQGKTTYFIGSGIALRPISQEELRAFSLR